MDITLQPIGVVRTPFQEQSGTPVQPPFADGARGVVVLDEPYAEAVADLDGFSHIWLLVHLDRARPWRPRVIPYRDTVERGLFATRSPSRPNPIGLSVVRLVGVRGRELDVADVDILDGTPLLDVKPYLPRIDSVPDAVSGWFGANAVERDRADGRFDAAGGSGAAE